LIQVLQCSYATDYKYVRSWFEVWMKPRGALWRTTHITKRLQLSRRAERFSTRNGNSIFSARCRHLCLSSTPRRCGGFFLRRIAANTVRKSSPKAAAKYSRSSAIGDCVARPAATVADAIISVSISLQQARKSGSCYSRTADPIVLKPGDMPPKGAWNENRTNDCAPHPRRHIQGGPKQLVTS